MPDGTPIIRDIAIRPQPPEDAALVVPSTDMALTFQNQPPTIRDIAVQPTPHDDTASIVGGVHLDSGWLV